MTDARDTDDPAAQKAAVAPKARGRLLRFLFNIGLIGAMFAIPYVASVQFRERGNTAETDKPAAEDGHAHDVPVKKADLAGGPTEILSRGDNALENLRYAEALSHYLEFLGAESSGAGLVHYRVGMCNESLGKSEDAIAAYRQAIGGTPSPALSFAGQLGWSRCLLNQNKAVEMRQLMLPFLLDETRHAGVPFSFVVEARYLVALSFARSIQHDGERHLSDDEPAPSSLVPFDVPYYLDDIAAAQKATRSAAAKDIAADHGAHAPGPALHSDPPKKDNDKPAPAIRNGPAIALVEELAKDAGLKPQWTSEARKALTDRTLRLPVKSASASELLETVADALGLCCVIHGEAVDVSLVSEAEPKSLKEFQHRLAERALRRAIVDDAAHPLAPAVYIELGNLEFSKHHWAEALAWYGRVVREVPSSPSVVLAYTNMARTHLHKADDAEARRHFFSVIDQAPGHELALQAYARIGQLYLEDDEPKEAIAHVARAQSLSSKSPTQPLIALVLAAAHLQKDDPQRARLVLAKTSTRLRVPPFRSDALVLDMLAQYRLAKPDGATRREASELLSALLSDGDNTVMGTYGQWLRATAYGELGFWDQAERILRLAGKHAHGPLASRIQFDLGEALTQQGKYDDAAVVLEKLAAQTSPFTLRARFHLARIDVQQRRFPAAIDKCRALWPQRGDVEANALLHVWGMALLEMNEFEKASKCFAGVAPE